MACHTLPEPDRMDGVHPAAACRPEARALSRRVAVALVVLAGLLTSACAIGPDGDEGRIEIRSNHTADITTADLGTLGIPTVGSYPAEDGPYTPSALAGTVTWHSIYDPDLNPIPTDYFADVRIEPNPGKEGESGIVNENRIISFPVLTAQHGDDGEVKPLFLLFHWKYLRVYRYFATIEGTPVP